MKSKTSLKYNIIYNIFYQLLALLVPLVTAPYISRVLGAEGMGIYGYTYSIAHYFVIFIMLGIVNYGNREIAFIKDQVKKSLAFWNIYSIQFFMGILCLGVYLLYVLYLCEEYNVIFYIQAIYILSSILDISWFYFGIEKYKLTTGISSINKVITAVCIFLFVKDVHDICVYTLILSIGVLLNNTLYWILLHKYVPYCKVQHKEIIYHILPILLLFLPVIAINIYRYIGKIMLGIMSDITEVGIYDAAEKFINLPLGIVAAIGTVMLSRISNLKSLNDNESIKKFNHISMISVMAIGIGISFGLGGIAYELIPFFYGKDFYPAINVLLFLLPSVLFICWSNVIRTQYLLPNRKDKIYCISVFIGAIVNVLFNIVLIPKYGAIGAALGTTVTEMIVCLFQSLYATKKMNLGLYLYDLLPFVVIGIVMYIIIVQISFSIPILTIIGRIFCGFFVYAVLFGIVYNLKIVNMLK